MPVEPVTVVAAAFISKHYQTPLCWAVLVGMDRWSPPNILCVHQKVSDGPSLAGSWTRAHIWVVMQSKVGSDDLPEPSGL